MISVVLPTLKRLDLAIDTIHNVYTKAANPDNVEVMLAFKTDDLESVAHIDELPDYPNLRWTLVKYDFGYQNLHDVTNEAASRCLGDAIGMFNDDATILTRGWDQMIEASLLRDPWSVTQIGAFTQFPFVSRKVFNCLGHYALHYSLDDYITYVAREAGIERRVPVMVHHVHKKDDAVAEDRQRVIDYMFATFHSKATRMLIRCDAERIKEAMSNDQARDV